MSRKFKVPLNLVGLSNDPSSASNGDLYFNTTANKVRYYTQNAWQDLGAAVGGAAAEIGSTVPVVATEGKLWYDNDDARLYVYDGSYWVEVSIGPIGPAGAAGAGVASGGTTGQYLIKSSNSNYATSWTTLPASSLTSTDVSRLTGATSNLQTQIDTLSTNLNNTLDDYVPTGDVGQPDGVASLDSAGKIPISQLGNLIDGAPAALDTLNELAAAINDDSSYASTITTALGLKAPLASPTFTGTVSGITNTMVGLGNVDNTADTAKPVSTATQTALNLKAPLASPTFTGTVILPSNTSGANLINIPNSALSNSSITINGSAVSLGGSATIAAGLTPVSVSTNITMSGNNRYFVDTTYDLTLTLPATPALGTEIELYDSSNNAFTNDVVILRNSEKINGLTDNASLDINGFAVSFIYTGSTYGWRMK